MKKIVFLALLFTSGLTAQDVTYSEHIAPIIYDHCSNCHRQNEIGPMALTNYEEVKSWANMIEYVTSIKYMPPWKPNPEYSTFLGENYLQESEIQLIKDWVADGTPQGDIDLEPEFPEFPPGSQVGDPDLVLSFEEAYVHDGTNEDEYRVFVLPTGLEEDKDLIAIELRPGNTKIVHHALFAYDDTGKGQQLDDATSEYGYDGFGGFGVDEAFDRQFPGYVPGQKARIFPENLGQELPANSDLLIQMHYAPFPTEEVDSSSVNLFFADGPVDRYVQNYVMLPFAGTLENGPFIMFPEEVKTFHGTLDVDFKLSLLGIAPHMHLLGQDWTVYVESPSGEITNLIEIKDWDFNWQGTYYFDEFKVIEPGSTIHGFATYDNTSENPLNPNDPPEIVSWGEKTTDEMYYLAFMFTPYKTGDEDVVFDDTQVSTEKDDLVLPVNKLYPVFPNPASENLEIGYQLEKGQRVNLAVYSADGKVVMNIKNGIVPPGRHSESLQVSKLENGIYFLTLQGEDFTIQEKFIVTKQ